MKKCIICFAIAGALYYYQQHHQAAPTPVAVEIQPTMVATPSVKRVVVPVTVTATISRGGLDDKGGWEFKSSFDPNKPSTDLKGGASWK
jgi:hypothetical protein